MLSSLKNRQNYSHFDSQAIQGNGTVFKAAQARLPTPHGEFELRVYLEGGTNKEHVSLTMGDLSSRRGKWQEAPLVRVHSECLTGDLFGSLRCDCGSQLQEAMRMIGEEGRGVILYLRQEGRDIGLVNKMRAYNLQDEGYDTVQANTLLGFQADERDFSIAANILRDLGAERIRLLTNNPEKVNQLKAAGIDIVHREQLEISPNEENLFYMTTKANQMGHRLALVH